MSTEEKKLDEPPTTEPAGTESAGKTQTWLSCELRLDDFYIKEEKFRITGWINVHWIWNKAPQTLRDWDGQGMPKPTDGEDSKLSKMIMFQNSKSHDVVKILDLRDSALSYYLPIDARKIFFQPSLQNIRHIDPPWMEYNKQTKATHTQYYITADLSEHLELFMFPFDRQFLNIKIRFNTDYFRILDFDNERDVAIQQQLFSSERDVQLFHEQPLKITLKESLHNEVKLYPAWIDFRVKKQDKGDNRDANLRFALIRLRVRRTPTYFVANTIIPFFIIVCSSFSVYAVSPQDTGDRLAVSVTILLTFTAFQSIVSEWLPQTSSMLMIDWYILCAYILQALVILGTCLVSFPTDADVVDTIDQVFLGVLGAFWAIFTVFYLSLKYQTMRNCYQAVCCCLRINFNDWQRRSTEEINEWIKYSQEVVTYDRIKRAQ